MGSYWVVWFVYWALLAIDRFGKRCKMFCAIIQVFASGIDRWWETLDLWPLLRLECFLFLTHTNRFLCYLLLTHTNQVWCCDPFCLVYWFFTLVRYPRAQNLSVESHFSVVIFTMYSFLILHVSFIILLASHCYKWECANIYVSLVDHLVEEKRIIIMILYRILIRS